MTVFVYEFCCAVGLGGSLGVEGRAMRDAVADDFRRLPGVTVETLDFTGTHQPWRFERAVTAADSTLCIAPETGGVLAAMRERVRAAGGRWLGSEADAITTTGDKLTLAAVWEASGVPTPRSFAVDGSAAVRLPVVVKPRDGAGSERTQLVERWEQFQELVAGRDDMMAQQPVPGRAASVAFLIGPAQTVPLLPTFQHLSDDGRFTYRGGALPIPEPLAERAVALGRRAVGCVPGLRGYVGVDLVLGDAADGSEDFAIEINPRLTTSYVGLRALAETNLAGAMLDVCAGRPVEIRWKPGRVRFTPDGVVSGS